jgi:hypothetical protein
MLLTTAEVPGIKRYWPRSGAATGPTSKRESALRAEMTHLSARMLAIEREQRVQFERMAQIQQQLDAIAALLKKIAGQ